LRRGLRDFNPSYSPSGKTIAYEVFDGNDSEICHEAKVDAGNGEILHHDLEDEPDESDAGERAGGF
jgi:hypothetical protein